MGLEIFEQLGGRLPDVIIYPAGGGVGLIGIHKAIGELRELVRTRETKLAEAQKAQSELLA